MTCADKKLVLGMQLSLEVVDYVPQYSAAFRCGDCRAEFHVHKSSSQSMTWGPRYRYPVYLKCRHCSNKYTVADLIDAVDGVCGAA